MARPPPSRNPSRRSRSATVSRAPDSIIVRAWASDSGIPLLLEFPAQLPVVRGVAGAEALDGALDLGLEIRLATIDIVEAARDLARDLDVRDLVLADRHVLGPVHQDVRALQQRIAEKAVGAEVLVLELLDLVLVGRHALEPGDRRDHGKDQVQFRVLRHARLHEDRAGARIEAGRQPVDQDLVRVGLKSAVFS